MLRLLWSEISCLIKMLSPALHLFEALPGTIECVNALMTKKFLDSGYDAFLFFCMLKLYW